MKKKVLIVNHSLQQGGIVRSLIAALNVIDPQKYEITLYVHRDMPDLAELVPSHVKVVINHDRNHYYRHPKAVALQALEKCFALVHDGARSKQYTEKLHAFVHDLKVAHPQKDYFSNSAFDVVIAYSVDICTEIALAIPAARHYAFFHSSKADFHREMTERCFPRFDKIVAVSSGVADVVAEGFPALTDRIVTLSNFVDGESLSRLAQGKKVYANEAGNILICSCGRLNHEKGYDLAVEAARLLKQQQKSFRWYFVGDGDERKPLEERIAAYGLGDDIVITGFLLNPYPYIGGCDIYVQPSYEEAQPLAVMEAFILGKAIVSTDTVGGNTILENGKKGIIVPINPEGVAQGIGRLIDDPALRHAFEKQYSAADCQRDRDEYAAAWEKLLSE